MTDPENEPQEEPEIGADATAIIYILGGIPAIVAFIVVLFVLTNIFPNIPA
ncbi:MAG: hypothetical protein QNK05_03250 [Myxococcota bacterium]|nr:hypothetical protein [Myxococcota bacterium]